MRVTFALLVAAILLTAVALLALPPRIPACEEDAVIVGIGDFEAGRWSGYECGPARDDFIEED